MYIHDALKSLNSKIINFTNAILDYLLTSELTNTPFQFPGYEKQF